jgi:hypothetical protein
MLMNQLLGAAPKLAAFQCSSQRVGATVAFNLVARDQVGVFQLINNDDNAGPLDLQCLSQLGL